MDICAEVGEAVFSTGAVRNVRVLGGVSGAELRAVLVADADSALAAAVTDPDEAWPGQLDRIAYWLRSKSKAPVPRGIHGSEFGAALRLFRAV